MGARGPAADPNKPRRRDLAPVVQLNAGLPAPPPAPRGLLAVNRKRWATYFSSDVSRAVTDVDLPAVERLWRYYDSWERAQAVGDTNEMVKLERAMQPIEDRLGLTPSARARLGITIGAAKKMSLQDLRKGLADG